MHSVAFSIPGPVRLRLSCFTQDILLVCQHHASPVGVCVEQGHEHGLMVKDVEAWSRLFRTSPAMLILAVDHFSCQFSRAPKDARQLIDWSASSMAKILAEPGVIRKCRLSKKQAKKSRAASQAWMVARTNKASCKAVLKFLQAATAKKNLAQYNPAIHGWIKTVFGNKLSAKQFGKGQSAHLYRRHQRLNAPVTATQISSATLRGLLEQARTARANETMFNERLQRAKLDAMKQLAYGASHEINNPLANIATGTQVLIQSEADVDRKDRLARIYAQAMAAHEMISDMMLFAHPPTPNFEETDLRLLIRAVALRHDPEDNQIRVTFGRNVDTAEVDANQITIVVEALLRNAKEALAGHDCTTDVDRPEENCVVAPIDLRVELCDGRIEISVSDSGPGMDAQTLEHLFDPFYSGREAGRGLGFGLSKAWRIVQLHGGKISAVRDGHAGRTTFHFWVPVKRECPGATGA